MHPKDPILDAQKTDITYHLKCTAHNCTAEYIGETIRSLKERVSDHRNQTISAIRHQHISTKHPKAELKDLTILDRDRNTLYPQGKEALHISIKDPSLNRNIGNVRTPSIFNKPLTHQRGHLLHLVFQHTHTKKTITRPFFLVWLYLDQFWAWE